MNNEQRTLNDFLQDVAKENGYDTWSGLVLKNEKSGKVIYRACDIAAQRFAAWKFEQGQQQSQWKIVEFANWLPSAITSNYKVYPQYFNIVGEGSTKRVTAKPTIELLNYWLKYVWDKGGSGLPVEQGQKADGWIFGSKLTERISAGLERELKRQKDSGKQRISGSELDKLIDNVIKEELGDAWKGSYAHNNSSIPLQSKKDNNETQV